MPRSPNVKSVTNKLLTRLISVRMQLHRSKGCERNEPFAIYRSIQGRAPIPSAKRIEARPHAPRTRDGSRHAVSRRRRRNRRLRARMPASSSQRRRYRCSRSGNGRCRRRKCGCKSDHRFDSMRCTIHRTRNPNARCTGSTNRRCPRRPHRFPRQCRRPARRLCARSDRRSHRHSL